MRKGNMLQHATWMMSFDFSENHLEEIQQFVIEAAKFLEADFGCMMLLTETEVEAGRKNGTVHPLDKKATRFNFISPSYLLQKYIPDVYWMTILGAPYVEMFGRSKLLSAPVHRAEAIGESIVMFQLTPTIKDGSADPARHGEAKVQLKTFLGENAFFKSGINQECIHPEFVWR